MKTATIPAYVRDAMLSHSLAELPNECCGLLLGSQAIERAVPMRSIPPAPDAGMDLQLAFHSDALYVIVSLADIQHPEFGAYRLDDGQLKKVEICYT
jgi:hypothetical protein